MSVSQIPAGRVPHAERAALWNEAFSDYYTPGSFTAESLAAFERAFGLDLEASRLVLEGERPVAFAMLGVRERRGWVGGMGVVPAARRRGHGERVMLGVLDAARERRLEIVRLEVLVQNEPAIPLYESLGFVSLRRLDVWDRAAGAPAPALPADAARAMPMDDAASRAAIWRRDRTPWQRELEPTRVAFPDVQALATGGGASATGAERESGALAIFRVTPERIGVVEIVAAPELDSARRDRAFDALLDTMFARFPSRVARFLNLPEGDPAGAALAHAGAAVSHQQWEMEIAI